MTPLAATLRRTVVALQRAAARSALIGGLAVSVRSEPRFTRDIDLAVAVPDDEGAEELVRSLVGEGFQLDTVIEQEATARLATVRLRPSASDGNVVDLLFASSGDLVDLRVLVAVADVTQLRLAATACAAIVERGFHRDRDLPRLFRELVV